MAFYRTYRPQVISEIDNSAVRETLLTLLAKGKKGLPHAYLFSGPKGTGKTTAARIVAKIFNCTKLTKSDGPCGKCEQCSAIAKGNSLDVLEIDAASNRGIDEIRMLRDHIALAPLSGEYKIYIIDEVHMLTMEAFNALLKTLEEPPPHAVFVLATTDPHKVPGTITSRAIAIAFSRATIDELVHALARIVRKEKITIDREALALIARVADGSFRDATKLLEHVSFKRGKITPAVVRQTLSLGEESIRQRLLMALAARKRREALLLVGQIVEKGYDVKIFIEDCLGELERLLVSRVLGEPTKKEEEVWDEVSLKEAIHQLTAAFSQMRLSPIPQLPLELAVVEFCGKEVEHRELSIENQDEKITKTNETRPPPSPAGRSKLETPRDPSPRGLLTLDKLTQHWGDFIASLKSYNHSVAGVLRSARPKAVNGGIVTIEAFYPFHKEKLTETKTHEVMVTTLKKLFGEKVKVEIVLGKK